MGHGRLGEFLVRQKAINERQLQEALQAQAAAMTHRFLGDIFIEQQILSREDFERLLRQFLAEKAADAREDELRLGYLLLDSGRLRLPDLEAVLARQRGLDRPVPLGQLLVAEGLLTAPELEVYLHNQQLMRDATGCCPGP